MVNPILFLYRNKYHNPPLPPPNSFEGQHILITGGNTGLGLHTALHCLNLGAASVIITSRDATKGAEARKWLLEKTSSKVTVVSVMSLDMSSFAGVVDFVERVKREISVLDVVYLNAGVQNLKGAVSPDGWELSFQVNLLSTALMAILLLPWLKVVGRGKAHLAFTGSGMHRDVDIRPASGWPQAHIFAYWRDPANVQRAGSVGIMKTGKLLLQYVMRELASLSLDHDGRPEVIVNSTCPGLVKSELGRDMLTSPLLRVLGNAVMTAFFKATEHGAVTLVDAALVPPEKTGRHFTHYQSEEEYLAGTEKNIHGVDGREMQRRVWRELLEVLAGEVPEVREIARLPRV